MGWYGGSPGGGGGGMAIGGAVTSGTPGSVLFIDGSTNLAQDNPNFYWDDSNYNLKIGHSGGPSSTAYFLGGLRALYAVPNAGGNNWFEGNSGNLTVTGYRNFATGDQSMINLITGYQNTAIGTGALYSCTTGHGNVGIGDGSLGNIISGSNNFAMGTNVLSALEISGTGPSNNNVGIGTNAGQFMRTASGNVAIGQSALGNVTVTGDNNTVIGTSAGANLGSGGASTNKNTMIGYSAGSNLSGGSSENTWIGGYRGPSAAVSNSVALSDSTYFLWEINIQTNQVWSAWLPGAPSVASGIHVYNNMDGAVPTVNYERGILDWTITSNIFRVGTQAGGSGTKRLVAIDGFAKAGAPAASDLPSGSFAVIDDTSGGQTWLCFNKAGTIRKVQLT